MTLSEFVDTEALGVIFYRETIFLARRKPTSKPSPIVAKPMNEMKLQREQSSERSVSSAVGEASRCTLVAHADSPEVMSISFANKTSRSGALVYVQFHLHSFHPIYFLELWPQ